MNIQVSKLLVARGLTVDSPNRAHVSIKGVTQTRKRICLVKSVALHTSNTDVKNSLPVSLERTICSKGLVFRTSDYFVSKPGKLIICRAGVSDDPEKFEEKEEFTIKSATRFGAIFLCAVAIGLSTANRSMLSVSGMAMANQFSWSASQYAMLQSSFLVGYPMTQMLGGMLSDCIGPRLMYAFAIGVMSVSTMVIPWVSTAPWGGLSLVCLMRFLFGFSSGIILPGSASAVARWASKDNKGAALSAIFVGLHLGSTLGMLGTPLVMTKFGGWQAPFVAIGLIGAAWVAVWLQATKPRPEDLQEASHQEPLKDRIWAMMVQYGRMMRGARVWGLVWTHAACNHIYLMLGTWTPFYLIKVLNTSMETAATLSVLPFFGMAAAATLSGISADYMIKHGMPTIKVRRIFMGLALLGPAAAMVFLMYATQPAVAILCIFTAMGLLATSQSGFHAWVQDVSPKEAGRVVGLTNSGGTFFSLFGTGAVGWVYEATGSFSVIFSATAAICLSGYLTFWLVSRGGSLLEEVSPQAVTA